LKPEAESNEQKPGRPAPPMRGQTLDIEVETLKEKRALIMGLSWPALAENILVSMVSIVSMIMVGPLGPNAIGAVGLVAQPRFVMLAAFMALNIGSTAIISRFKGAKDVESANMVLGQSLVMAAGVTLILCLAMYFGGEALLRVMTGRQISEDMIQMAMVFLRIQVLGFPTLAFTFTINAILRGVGNTQSGLLQ
jgi:Na+-driven multidrug efflux pump